MWLAVNLQRVAKARRIFDRRARTEAAARIS
jgi:hypothetical protein